jgi:hypothetical protein
MNRHHTARLGAIAAAVLTAVSLGGAASAGTTAAEPAGWTAAGDSRIIGPYSATLTGANTSVETEAANIAVKAGQTITARYKFTKKNQSCTAGGPRIAAGVKRGGDTTSFNSWDQNYQAGTQCGKNGVLSVTVPSRGTLKFLGMVWDNGQGGTIRMWDLRVNGARVKLTPILVTPGEIVVHQPTCANGRQAYVTAPETPGLNTVITRVKPAQLNGKKPWSKNLMPGLRTLITPGEYVAKFGLDTAQYKFAKRVKQEVEFVVNDAPTKEDCKPKKPAPTVTPSTPAAS